VPTKRFESLDPERKALLLDAAAAEFAAHGFEAASFNRIIERAGTSKGAIYYYFEDKADLYATVVRDAVTRFVAYCGPIGPASDAAAYWAEVERMSQQSLRYYRRDPHIAGLVRSLVRDGLAVAPVVEIRALTAAWLAQLALVGQAVGAIRDDLPLELVLSVGTAVTEGFDLWLVQHLDELDDAALDRLAAVITDLYRRMATPVEAG
jgi:AcrR family transcriptional regulator